MTPTAPAGSGTAPAAVNPLTGAAPAAAALALLQRLAVDARLTLTAHTGGGVSVTLPAGPDVRVEVDGDGEVATLAGSTWRVRVDAVPVRTVAIVEDEGLDLGGGAAVSLHLRGFLGNDTLRFAFRPGEAPPAAEQQAFWRDAVAPYAGALPVRLETVARRAPDAPLDPQTALRFFVELRETGRAIVEPAGPQGSAEIQPNVPLVEPHLSARGWLLAGEPYPRDAHVHVSLHDARLRFVESGPPLGSAFVLTGGEGQVRLFAFLRAADDGAAGPSGGPAGRAEPLEGSLGELRALYERYGAEPGVAYVRSRPLTPA